jgi:hypothetical protein
MFWAPPVLKVRALLVTLTKMVTLTNLLLTAPPGDNPAT